MTRGRWQPPAEVRLVFDGQSHNLDPPTGSPMPGRVMATLGLPGAVIAVNGAGWLGLTPTAPTRLFPHRRSHGIDLLVMNGGQNDILGGASGEEAYDAAVAYAEAAIAVGFGPVVACTMPPLGDVTLPNIAPYWAQFQAHNVLMRAGGPWDAVADFEQPPLMDPLDGYHYMDDKTHWADPGAAAAAAIVAPVLAGLLP